MNYKVESISLDKNTPKQLDAVIPNPLHGYRSYSVLYSVQLKYGVVINIAMNMNATVMCGEQFLGKTTHE